MVICDDLIITLVRCFCIFYFTSKTVTQKNGETQSIEPIAIKEVIYQSTAYLGVGRVYDFLIVANQIVQQHGIKLPLSSQATTSEKTRFEAGLKKQVDLFGPDMAKRQTEGPALRRNINHWLAQGVCENQLRGHTAGNFGVGNNKEKLYSVVEQCMPYIGYQYSFNAMNIIDEVSKNLENK